MHTQPDIRPVKESGDIYELFKDYDFKFKGQDCTVQKGFRHDGATGAQFLFGKDGVHRAAALVHDYLYINRGFLKNLSYTRKDADRKFQEMLIDAGVKSWHINLAYFAVRIFGAFYWRPEWTITKDY